MAKSNFIVRGGANFNPLYNEFNRAQKKMGVFQAGMSKTLKRLGLVVGTLAIGRLIKDSVKSAMTVESSMAQIGRTMGSSANEFGNWANTQAKSFGMAREEAFKYGAVYSNLISSFASGTKETTKYTTDLMKASAVVASGTGRTMEDTMDRIRSGLLGNTESIEDLGINVNVAMLESTKAFQKFANGKSWQQLTFQEQQQIRLMAILEQANVKYGNSLAGTTATNQMMFLATLRNIRLNLGQAFLPIYNIVLPLLTALASKLEYITGLFAAFTQALFGKSVSAQAKNTQAQASAVGDLGDATEAAGKKAKGAMAGFDEINNLDLGDSGGTGGGIAAGVGAGGVEEVDDGTGGMMDQVSIKATEMATKVKEAFTNMKNAIVENKDIILPALGAIAGALTGLAIYSGILGIIDFFKKFGAAVKLAWAFLAANPIVLVVAAIGALIGILITAYLTNDEFRAKVDKLWSTIKTALTPVVQKLGEILMWVWQSVILPLGRIIVDVLVVAFDALTYVAKWLWEYVLAPLGKFIIESLVPVFIEIARIVGTVLKFAIEGLIKVFEFLWYSVLKPIVLWLGSTFKPVFESVGDGIKTVIGGLKTTFDGLITFITGVFTGNWSKAWEGVKQIFKGVFDTLYGIAKTPLNLIIDAVNTIIKGLNKIKFDIPSWVPGIGGKSFGINISTIPKLATGGITNGPMMAMIGDNPGGREVVSPLDDLTSIIASAVGSAMLGAMQFGSAGASENKEVVLELDGVKLGRVLLPKLNQEADRLGFKPILQTE